MKNKTQYAIVDIETTGGYAAGSGITEIAILIHDGEQVLERFETLVDPQRYIPPAIEMLTGISEDMVSGAPVFEDIAEQVYYLLAGRVFVAHNVNFDYSFIKHHLEAAGYQYAAPKLCTVRLSRKIKPGLPSYSLGNLCDALGIPISNRHRAGGDADATAILFTQLHAWDEQGHIGDMLKKTSKEQALPPNLPREDFEALPSCPGVYYFRNKAGKVIYVGKATNLRKRVSSHFTGHNPNPQRQNFLRNIYSIDFERCGTELMALLLETTEIKRLWPEYNRAMKRQEPKFALYAYEDLNGYMRLAVGKYNSSMQGIHVFNRESDARDVLHRLVRNFGLCPALSMLGPCTGNCYTHEDRESENTCVSVQHPDIYNTLVQDALRHYENNLPSFALFDKGRNEEEQSCIWVEQGRFYGMGYIDLYTDIQNPADLKSLLTPYSGNAYMLQLIHTYADKYPAKVKRFDQLQQTPLSEEEAPLLGAAYGAIG